MWSLSTVTCRPTLTIISNQGTVLCFCSIMAVCVCVCSGFLHSPFSKTSRWLWFLITAMLLKHQIYTGTIQMGGLSSALSQFSHLISLAYHYYVKAQGWKGDTCIPSGLSLHNHFTAAYCKWLKTLVDLKSIWSVIAAFQHRLWEQTVFFPNYRALHDLNYNCAYCYLVWGPKPARFSTKHPEHLVFLFMYNCFKGLWRMGKKQILGCCSLVDKRILWIRGVKRHGRKS